jgi:hypothetical protein
MAVSSSSSSSSSSTSSSSSAEGPSLRRVASCECCCGDYLTDVDVLPSSMLCPPSSSLTSTSRDSTCGWCCLHATMRSGFALVLKSPPHSSLSRCVWFFAQLPFQCCCAPAVMDTCMPLWRDAMTRARTRPTHTRPLCRQTSHRATRSSRSRFHFTVCAWWCSHVSPLPLLHQHLRHQMRRAHCLRLLLHPLHHRLCRHRPVPLRRELHRLRTPSQTHWCWWQVLEVCLVCVCVPRL